ncbi:Coiled-coil domain-containing 25 [Micractinium conductrix]|uniref:Coiled-coil domain-containing 25 n=1 Tax=Micractinium conductrix TaxID=554055 RepID=A0A2P6VHE5_9CHLO|nr:Coiled-coil domain-containing 25 [Micractinium conductrix]|eukprot:PSC73498.1 Coiled-coil domain-containing 25 [Micractinium conductrix]
MVFFFTPRGHGPGPDDWLLYMGVDKYENEDLIKYSLPTDVWFHVDALSSAHVYLRLPEGKSMGDIPKDTLEDACQLVKANSIVGNKQNNLAIVYTPASNLRKSSDMAVGQVGFHSDALVKKAHVARRLNEIVNRLNKTQVEKFPDLAAEKMAWEKEQTGKRKAESTAQRRTEKEEKDEQKRQQDMLDYKHIMREESMVTAGELREKYETAEDYEDDFM